MDKIAIIGAGISGLAAGIYLAKAGYHVDIFEQAEKPTPIGAGFLLQPPGQFVLQDLGVLGDIQKQAVPINRLQSITVTGNTLLDLNYTDLPAPARHGLGVERHTIFSSLYAQAQKSGVHFHWGHKVTDIDQKDCLFTTLECDVKNTAPIITEPYDLFLLASGATNKLADPIFSQKKRHTYPWGCLWATVDLPPSFAVDTLHQRCAGSKKMMGLLPVLKTSEDTKAALYWSIKQSDITALKEGNFSVIIQEMISLWPDAEPAVSGLSFADMTPAVYYDNWTSKPFKNNLIVLGDQSHATSPQLGQGCTMALLDAYELCQLIINGPSPLGDISDLAHTWWQNRKYQLAFVRYASKFLTPLYQSDNQLYSLFRDYIMAPMGKLPGLYRVQLKTLASDILCKSPKGPA